MSTPSPSHSAPGDDSDSFISGFTTYAIGLALALVLTATSFWGIACACALGTWSAGWPHCTGAGPDGRALVFFLHITTGPDNSNNVLALAFGMIIVFLVVVGSLWIMGNLNHMMPSMREMMDMQP